MVKYFVAIVLLAVTAANGFILNGAQNSATNNLSPDAQIHHNHLQNTYDYTGGNYGGYYPYGGGYGGYGGYGAPYGGLGGLGLGGFSLNMPINRADNHMSPGALITNTNGQNTYRF